MKSSQHFLKDIPASPKWKGNVWSMNNLFYQINMQQRDLGLGFDFSLIIWWHFRDHLFHQHLLSRCYITAFQGLCSAFRLIPVYLRAIFFTGLTPDLPQCKTKNRLRLLCMWYWCIFFLLFWWYRDYHRWLQGYQVDIWGMAGELCCLGQIYVYRKNKLQVPNS